MRPPSKSVKSSAPITLAPSAKPLALCSSTADWPRPSARSKSRRSEPTVPTPTADAPTGSSTRRPNKTPSGATLPSTAFSTIRSPRESSISSEDKSTWAIACFEPSATLMLVSTKTNCACFGPFDSPPDLLWNSTRRPAKRSRNRPQASNASAERGSVWNSRKSSNTPTDNGLGPNSNDAVCSRTSPQNSCRSIKPNCSSNYPIRT